MAALDALTALFGRLGQTARKALDPKGALAAAVAAATGAPPADLFKELVGLLRTLCTKAVPLPEDEASSGAPAALRRQLHVSAFAALTEVRDLP